MTVGDDRSVLVWDAASRSVRERLAGHAGRIFGPVLSPQAISPTRPGSTGWSSRGIQRRPPARAGVRRRAARAAERRAADRVDARRGVGQRPARVRGRTGRARAGGRPANAARGAAARRRGRAASPMSPRRRTGSWSPDWSPATRWSSIPCRARPWPGSRAGRCAGVRCGRRQSPGGDRRGGRDGRARRWARPPDGARGCSRARDALRRALAADRGRGRDRLALGRLQRARGSGSDGSIAGG